MLAAYAKAKVHSCSFSFLARYSSYNEIGVERKIHQYRITDWTEVTPSIEKKYSYVFKNKFFREDLFSTLIRLKLNY